MPEENLIAEGNVFYLTVSGKCPFHAEPLQFNNVEINYINGGHVFSHLGVPYDIAYYYVFYWKAQYKDPAGNPVQPSVGTWYWFNKGYNEYEIRKDW
jgi:hypothetical protein